MDINTSGTFVLFFANLISKLFGAFYRFPLSNLLGAEGMGLYQMAFPIYSFLLTLLTGGISITLTRKIANLRAEQNEKEIYKLFLLGRNSSLIYGFVFLLVLLIFAYPLSIIQGNSNAVYGYFAISVGFVFASLLGAYRGYYQGYNNMRPTAISQVLEQGAKLVFGLLFAFVFLKKGVNSGVFGALLGISFSEIVSFVYFKIINKKRISKHNISITKSDYKAFLKQVAPVSVSYVLLPLSNLLDSLLVVNLLKLSGYTTQFATSLYGIETGMILPLINLPNVLVSAFALASLPNISYKLSKGQNIQNLVNTMFKLVLFFILPCCVGMFVLAEPILLLIFPTLDGVFLTTAVNLLKFSVVEMFFLSFVTISNSLLQALNKIKLPAISLGIGITVKFFLSIFFISNNSFNIYGLVIASIFCYFVTALINVIKIKNYTQFRIKLIPILSTIFSTILMTVFVFVFTKFVNISKNILFLFIAIIFAIVIYFGCLILLKQFSFKDIKTKKQT